MSDPEPKTIVLEEPKQGITSDEVVKGMHWNLPESTGVAGEVQIESLEASGADAEGVLTQS